MPGGGTWGLFLAFICISDQKGWGEPWPSLSPFLTSLLQEQKDKEWVWSEQVRGLRVGMDEGSFLGLCSLDRTVPDNQARQAANWCPQRCWAGTSCCHQGSTMQRRCFSGGSRPCYAQEVVALPNSQREEKPTIQVPVPQGCLVSPQS